MASRSKDSSTTAKIGGPQQRQSVAAVRLVRPVRVLRGPPMGQCAAARSLGGGAAWPSPAPPVKLLM